MFIYQFFGGVGLVGCGIGRDGLPCGISGAWISGMVGGLMEWLVELVMGRNVGLIVVNLIPTTNLIWCVSTIK